MDFENYETILKQTEEAMVTMTAKQRDRMVKAHTEIQKQLSKKSAAWTFYQFKIENSRGDQRTITVCIAALNNEATRLARGIAIRCPNDAVNPLIGQVRAGRRALRAIKINSIVCNKATGLERGHIAVGLKGRGLPVDFMVDAHTGKRHWVSGHIVDSWTDEEKELLTRNMAGVLYGR